MAKRKSESRNRSARGSARANGRAPARAAKSAGASRAKRVPRELPKAPSGVDGLDEVTGGGLPRGRPTLVCGGAGCGKSLLAMEFLVRGVTEHGEHGVFVSFEEPIADLVQNFASLGFDLPGHVEREELVLDHVHIERNEIEEAGEYDLEGLFIRLQHSIESVGAKRIVLDTIESLFSGLSNAAVLRSELRRLFAWLKSRKITAIVTAERGEGSLTRHGLEEYVSDCVILLDHRVVDNVATRRLRVVKYRGSMHGTNEYPFLIDDNGISVLPLTSLGLDHLVSNQRISTGIAGLDEMLGGEGYFRGSSILVTGTAGTGKSTLGAAFVAAACKRGERAVFFAFEEARGQILRNMTSVGIDLSTWVDKRTLSIQTTRPTYFGLEMHLVYMHKVVTEFEPDVVVIDPISNLVTSGSRDETKNMLLRLVDFLKGRGITAVFTSLTHTEAGSSEESELGVSSLMDTWILLRDVEVAGERNRGLNIVKSRGMGHSNQIREFVIGDDGVELCTPYLGQTGILTGSARLAEEARAAVAEGERVEDARQRLVELERKRRATQAQIALLQAELESENEAMRRLEERESRRTARAQGDSARMASNRSGSHARRAPSGTRRPTTSTRRSR